MLTRPRDILETFPVRRTKAQKESFRDAVQLYLEKLGYSCSTEEGAFGSRNLLVGDPENAQYLLAAHYDTCARLPFPNLLTPFSLPLTIMYQLFLFLVLLIPPLLVGLGAVFCTVCLYAVLAAGSDAAVVASSAVTVFNIFFLLLVFLNCYLIYFGPANQNNANDNTSGVITLLEIARTLPENQRHKVCFVLFDLEEKGLWGSRSHRKAHTEATERQMIINLDCVGDGDHIRIFPTKKLLGDKKRLSSLYKACGYWGRKSILIQEKGFAHYPSDHRYFPYGIGICALRKNKYGYYLSRIHTNKDTILDEINVNILRAALTTIITCDS